MTAAVRKAARAAGQHLEATVFVGRLGATDAAAEEVRVQLKTRPFVKVRVSRDAEGGRHGAAENLAELAGADLVEVRGFTALLAARKGGRKRE